MRQTNKEQLARGEQLLEQLRELRGGSVVDFQKRMSNDPALMNAFVQQYINCNKQDTVLPRKYREMIMMVMGCAAGVEHTILTHGRLAIEHGATVEEMGDVLRLVFFMAGATAVIPAMKLFDLPEEQA